MVRALLLFTSLLTKNVERKKQIILRYVDLTFPQLYRLKCSFKSVVIGCVMQNNRSGYFLNHGWSCFACSTVYSDVVSHEVSFENWLCEIFYKPSANSVQTLKQIIRFMLTDNSTTENSCGLARLLLQQIRRRQTDGDITGESASPVDVMMMDQPTRTTAESRCTSLTCREVPISTITAVTRNAGIWRRQWKQFL